MSRSWRSYEEEKAPWAKLSSLGLTRPCSGIWWQWPAPQLQRSTKLSGFGNIFTAQTISRQSPYGRLTKTQCKSASACDCGTVIPDFSWSSFFSVLFRYFFAILCSWSRSYRHRPIRSSFERTLNMWLTNWLTAYMDWIGWLINWIVCITEHSYRLHIRHCSSSCDAHNAHTSTIYSK